MDCNMTLNSNVNADTERFSGSAVVFTPDEGYALWRDNEEGNLDENGQPICYWLTMIVPISQAENYAPHIWAKLIDETMEVYGNVNRPAVMMLSLDDEESVEPSHTYIDENGVEREKKGVY